jgi:hypothetical protein
MSRTPELEIWIQEGSTAEDILHNKQTEVL